MSQLHEAKEMNSTLLRAHASTNVGLTQSYPRLIALTVLERCNLNCKMCYQNHKSSDEMSFDIIKKIEPVLPFVEVVNITGGEPLLYKHIDRFFTMCQRNGCSPSIQTNGLLLDEDRTRYLLDRKVGALKISCDGATEKTYQAIRHGGNFKKLVNNIATLQKLKTQNGEGPTLEFNFVGMASNVHELPSLILLAHRLGVEVVNVFPLRVAREHLITESLFFYQAEADAYYAEAKELADRLKVQLNLPPLFSVPASGCAQEADRSCITPWESMTVDLNGEVAICCGGAGKAGNLNTDSFMDVWHHPVRIKYRETVNTENELPACKKCRMSKPIPGNIRSHIPDEAMAQKALDMFDNKTDNPLPPTA